MVLHVRPLHKGSCECLRVLFCDKDLRQNCGEGEESFSTKVLWSCSTCSGAGGRGAFVHLNEFKGGIQFQDDPVEIVQSDVEIVFAAVVVLAARLWRGFHSNGLAHP